MHNKNCLVVAVPASFTLEKVKGSSVGPRPSSSIIAVAKRLMHRSIETYKFQLTPSFANNSLFSGVDYLIAPAKFLRRTFIFFCNLAIIKGVVREFIFTVPASVREGTRQANKITEQHSTNGHTVTSRPALNVPGRRQHGATKLSIEREREN